VTSAERAGAERGYGAPASEGAWRGAGDPAIAGEAREGDSQAFRALVERHSRSLYRLAYRMTGSREDAEDVMQEAFLRAHRQLHRFEARADVGTWLYRIAVNCCYDHLRSRAKHIVASSESVVERAANGSSMSGPAPDQDRLLFSAQVRERIDEALGGLSPAERAAFVLRHYEGRSIDEIGRALGLSASAAKHSVFRAVQKMRSALEPMVAARDGT
jgi:RNA polymerase sigma-70 factor (ECF subfamily)